MSLAQQPPFLIYVPIDHDKSSPGDAVREIEALLDRVGNPVDRALKWALDATKVIHFFSMSVIWDESDDPPILVADIAADGEPKAIIAALVKYAGTLLLPIFKAAAGVEDTRALRNVLERNWVKPVGAALPLWPRWIWHRATGLAFQGTPDLTLKRIRDDEKIALAAKAAVFGHKPAGPSAALSYLGAARAAVRVSKTSAESFNYSDATPSLASAGVFALAWIIFGLIVLDWSFLFVTLLSILFLNFRDLIIPLKSDIQGQSDKFAIFIAFGVLFAVSVNLLSQSFKNFFSGIFASKTLSPLISLLVLFDVLLAVFYILPQQVPGWLDWFTPVLMALSRLDPQGLLVLWIAFALSVVALALFVVVVAGILLWFLREAEKQDRPCDADPNARLLSEIIRREDLPPHKQNHMISVSTISPGPLTISPGPLTISPQWFVSLLVAVFRWFVSLLVAFFRRFISLPAGLYAASLTVRSGLFRTGYLAGISTIHFIQWARIPGTGKLVFTANYDGSFQSYLEDAITLLPGGATGIWSNAKGFPKTRWLFLDGATDGDRFKRWVRRQMIPTRFWYSAYPHLTATDIRLNAGIRSGLEANDITASQAEAWLKLFGSAPRPVSEIEIDQIQGLALVPYRRLVEGALLALSFPEDPAACRSWLAAVKGRIAFGDTGISESAMAMALSARGMERLGLNATDPLAAQFLPAFAMGMADKARANVLGDVDGNAPESWKWGGPRNPVDAVLLIYAEDRPELLSRLTDEGEDCARRGLRVAHRINLHRWPPNRQPIREPFGFVDGISQPSIKGLISSRGALATDQMEPGEFILGYPDGRQQFPPTPQVFATDDPGDLLPDLPPDFPPPPSNQAVRDLGRNGSYLVIRQLDQDVVKYQNYVNAAAAKLGVLPDRIGAKMVGRWPDGAPIVLFPHGQPHSYDPLSRDENFLFGRDDPQGLACPFGAHVRRANPRDQFDADNKTQMSITNRHRILRRGRSYVGGDNSLAYPQGLVFMCLNSDIERQFEFLQQTWIGSTSFNGLRDEADPLTTLNRTNGTYTIPTLTGPKQLTGLPSFVSVIGGGYFFLPGKQALNYLSR